MQFHDFSYLMSVLTGFFAIMNPIANAPIFLGLTQTASDEDRNAVALQSVVTAFVIVTAFVLAGKIIFQVFGLTVPAFKITGGILVFYVGFEMLQSKPSSVHGAVEAEFDRGIAVSPLAIPILAGPGTIVTAMNLAQGAGTFHMSMLVGGLAFMLLLTWIAFRSSQGIVAKVGQAKIAILGKIMGLIVAVIGTGMVIDGIQRAFPGH